MNPASNLIARLPAVRGRLRENAPLAAQTWFRVGGAAEVLFKPADEQDLAEFLQNCPIDIPIHIIGASSNLIIRDGGLPGVTIKLGGEFGKVEFISPLSLEGEGPAQRGERGNVPEATPLPPSLRSGTLSLMERENIVVGAAALDTTVAQFAAQESITGFEFLSGIPGTIGGALRMNAGAYGSEIKDILHSATAVDRAGNFHTVSAAELNLTYRHSGAPADWIFTHAVFHARPGNAHEIQHKMQDIKSKREETQPVRSRTGGSTFANPAGLKAWALIDAAGCRGLQYGGAMVSELHCNFLINTGNATADDLEKLGEMVRERVLAHSGIDLRWEIQRIGIATTNQIKSAA